MNKAHLKQALALALIGVAVAGVAAVTGRIGSIVERSATGADPAAAFTEVTVPVDPAEIRWHPDAALPRAMEPGTRDAVGEAYLLSLALLDGSLPVDEDDLAVHLTGPALAAARDAGPAVEVLARSHEMRFLFYSADGQVVEFEDAATRVVALDRSTALVRHETAVAVMVSIDGEWHLRHRLITKSGTVELAATAADAFDHPSQAHVQHIRKETP